MQATALAALTIALATACDALIYDDLTDCPQTMVFTFYRQTPCETQPYYPAEIREVRVFAFDSNDVLASQWQATGLTLRGDYSLTTTFNPQGDFTFAAWAAADFSGYNLSALEKGVTTRQQLTLTMNHAAANDGSPLQATGLQQPQPLYFGRHATPVGRHYANDEGSHTDSVAFNLIQMTNRVNVTVYGLEPTHEYRIYIADNNDQYNLDGQIVTGREHFDYTSLQDKNEGVYRCRFTTLKLEEGRGTELVVYDKTTDTKVFKTLLVDDLIMYRGIFGTPPYTLDCDHDFNVILWLERQQPPAVGTYMAGADNVDTEQDFYHQSAFETNNLSIPSGYSETTPFTVNMGMKRALAKIRLNLTNIDEAGHIYEGTEDYWLSADEGIKILNWIPFAPNMM